MDAGVLPIIAQIELMSLVDIEDSIFYATPMMLRQ